MTDQNDRARLIKVLTLMASDNDGEALNAARRAEALRKELGIEWDELLVDWDRLSAIINRKTTVPRYEQPAYLERRLWLSRAYRAHRDKRIDRKGLNAIKRAAVDNDLKALRSVARELGL
jgi:hypothetical protein